MIWLCLSFSSLAIAQTIQIDSTFSTNGVVYPFSQVDSIYGLNVSGHITLYSDTSFVRMVLVDENNIKYMVYEAYPLITTSMNFDITNICDETCYLNEIKPVSLIIYVNQASFIISSITYFTHFVEYSELLGYQSKRLNDTLKVQNMNSNILSKGWNWVAGHTPVVEMTYEEKANQFGDYYNLQGFEYYIEGVYDYISKYQDESYVSNIVENFDWRDRHGANINEAGNIYYGGPYGWITPLLKSQGSCLSCTAFGITSLIESMTNLYFNSQYQLDLSEMDVWCGCSGVCATGGLRPSIALNKVRDYGIVNEECYIYEPPCSSGNSICLNPDIKIKIDEYKTVDNYGKFDSIKSQLIRYGPLSQWLLDGNFNHEMLLIGYRFDAELNTTIWIYKDSYNTIREMRISSTDVMHQTHAVDQGINLGMHQLIGNDYDRNCRDYDQDGYYNWGVGFRMDNCGDENIPQDSDDSNPRLGPFDDNYFSVPVEPVMMVKQGNSIIHQNGFYSFYNGAWPVDHEEVLTFTITNTGTAQLNHMPNLFGEGTISLNDNTQNDFSVESDVLSTTIPMGNGFTTFSIKFKLNEPITETKMITVTIHLDEDDMEDFIFTIVFTECADNIAIESVQESTTWDGTMIKLGDVIVETDAVLTITGNVAFSQDANLFVEKGGTLIIDGGHLTSLCNPTWKGVDVWGDINKTQYYNPPQVRQEQGVIRIINGGKISYAKQAIETIRYINDIADLTTSGGIVIINDGNIENCIEGVVFYPYENFYPDKSYPQTNWSRFNKAHFINDQVYPEAQIYFNGVAGITIRGSNFDNKVPVSILQNTTQGIYSYNSGFSVSQTDLPPYPTGGSIQSTFKGFDYGIYALSGRKAEYMSIRSSVFEDNKRSIYLSSIETAVINQNEFRVRDNFSKYDDDTDLIGLYLDNQSSNFTIEENQFYSKLPYSSLLSKKCVGIVVNNSGQQPNELYNNSFDKLTVGIEAIGENRDAEGAGLCIKCNDFNECVTDIYVALDENPSSYQGIALKQGEVAPEPPPGTEPDPTISAGNTFSAKYDNTINYFNEEDCYPIIYTFHGNNNTPFKIEPYPIYPPLPSTHINLSPDTYVTFNSKNDACPSSIGGSINTTLDKVELENEIIIAESYMDTLNMLVDGGDTESLNWDVQMSFPGEALEIRQLLLNESPYLSDTVMKSAIGKENVLPNAMIRDVLTANPQSAKSPEVLKTINGRINPMPDYMMDEIMQGATVYGSRELVEQQLVLHKTKRDKSLTKLLRHYRSDTLNQAASTDSIIVLLQSQLYPESQYELAMLYVNRNDSINAFATLENINTNFDLTQKQAVVHALYADLLTIQWEMKKTNALLPDSLQINELFDIASYLKTKPGTYALNMLIRAGELLYEEPVYFPPTFKVKPIWNLNGKKENKKPSFLMVFPNPAVSYLTAEYLIQEDVTRAFVTLCDMEGKVLKKIDLPNKQSQIIVPTDGCSAGTYVLKLIGNGKVIDSKKVVIVN